MNIKILTVITFIIAHNCMFTMEKGKERDGADIVEKYNAASSHISPSSSYPESVNLFDQQDHRAVPALNLNNNKSGVTPSDGSSNFCVEDLTPRTNRDKLVFFHEKIRVEKGIDFKNKMIRLTLQELKKSTAFRYGYLCIAAAGGLVPIISLGLFQLFSTQYHELMHKVVCGHS